MSRTIQILQTYPHQLARYRQTAARRQWALSLIPALLHPMVELNPLLLYPGLLAMILLAMETLNTHNRIHRMERLMRILLAQPADLRTLRR